jgi:hypothetical protein
MKLSEHLSLSEVIRSESAKRNGISNMPIPQHIENFKLLAEKVFEPVRVHFGVPIHISSGYRSKELNQITVGASKTSDHCFGRAIDIDMDGHNSNVSNNDIFHWVIKNLKFKQVIAEYPTNGELSWVHISYDEANLKNEILICVRKDGKPHYLPYKGNEKLIK